MGVFTEIAESMEETESRVVMITKLANGDLRITATDPNAKDNGALIIKASPHMLDSIAFAMRNFGVDAAAILFQSSMNGKITTLAPDDGTFEMIQQRRKPTYYEHGKGGSNVEMAKIFDAGDALMDQRDFKGALEVFKKGLTLPASTKRKKQLDRRIANASTAMQMLKVNSGAKRGPKPKPKPGDKPPVVNPESQIEGMAFDPGEPPEPTIGDVVVNENANNTNPTDELKLF
jgi:hypothetical protein